MNDSKNQKLAAENKSSGGSRTALLTVLLLALSSLASVAQVTVVPIDARPNQAYGKKYEKWAEAWWQWAFSAPASVNPLLDTTGAFAGVGQSGPVWFLGGALGGGDQSRTFTMPAGKAIFIPVYQWIFGATVGDCRPSNPGTACQVPDLQASAAAAATSVLTMVVTVDGQSLGDLKPYHAASSGAFPVTLPADNLPAALGLPVPAGTFAPQVTDGYWLLLNPLPTGGHVIVVSVTPDPAFGIPFNVTYNINVAPLALPNDAQ
jgi:hypothetical protein